MQSMASHGDDARRVLNFELLELIRSFRKPVFFVCQSHLDTPTDQEIRACDRQGKPKPWTICWVEHLDFCKFAEKLTLVIAFGL